MGTHFGSTMQIAALGVVGQIIQTSANVKDALLHACAFVHLLTDFYTMEVEEHKDTFSILFRHNKGSEKYPNTRDQMGDFLAAFALYELNGLLMVRPKPVSVGLPTYKTSFDREYMGLFRCQPKRSTHYRLEFQKAFLQEPIITANYEIQTLLLGQISSMSGSSTLHGRFSARIFNYLIANSYLNAPSLETVAGNFCMSARTLQRKLKEEGVSFLDILEEVRKSLAVRYIQNDAFTVKEISQVLGYAEPAGFVRAFKRWTGQTPTDYREWKNIQHMSHTKRGRP
ncbi:AraC family transcriptional regulator [Chitinophaga sedimenti]|uniref:helix-turn-helix domain-containing protein n=1 Tax=Chitinophaga sedimenti TaxID=2033606 RepID=UPI002005BFC8|nr:AraC family transcriptional regulator [Chitinophaga sedimenti]MCK7555047.1 AraC family transcriptional regulator [Chitinophaga sedimenti]